MYFLITTGIFIACRLHPNRNMINMAPKLQLYITAFQQLKVLVNNRTINELKIKQTSLCLITLIGRIEKFIFMHKK